MKAIIVFRATYKSIFSLYIVKIKNGAPRKDKAKETQEDDDDRCKHKWVTTREKRNSRSRSLSQLNQPREENHVVVS